MNYVTVPDLGNSFDLGGVEANKIHIKTDNTLTRDITTGQIGVNPAALAGLTSNDLALTGVNLTSTVNGVGDTVDLTPAVKAAETVTMLGYDPATKVLTYTNEAGAVINLDLSLLAVDIFVNGATLDPATLVMTLPDNDGATPDVTVDLTELKEVETLNSTGIAFSGLGTDGSKLTASLIIDPVAGNLLSIGASGHAVLPSAVIALATEEVQNAFGTHLGWMFP